MITGWHFFFFIFYLVPVSVLVLDINFLVCCLEQFTLSFLSQEFEDCVAGQFGVNISQEVAIKMLLRVQSSEVLTRLWESASRMAYTHGCYLSWCWLCGKSQMLSMWASPDTFKMQCFPSSRVICTRMSEEEVMIFMTTFWKQYSINSTTLIQ